MAALEGGPPARAAGGASDIRRRRPEARVHRPSLWPGGDGPSGTRSPLHARFDTSLALQGARQFELQPIHARVNPPANALETEGGGFLVSPAAVWGPGPVRHLVRVDADGLTACGAGAKPPTTSCQVTSQAVTPAVSNPPMAFALLPFSRAALPVTASPHCP